ncbi:beta strand repeat-containing protein [Rariglobus hedericola]|nr:autotransporter-associated beta strand repeat-containing protein [Rariglobus hedericola]
MNTHRPRALLAIQATDSKSKTARRPITAISLSTFLTLMLGLVTCSAAHAASGTWNVDADGNWSNGANWTPGIADGTTFTANLTFNLTGDRVVTLDSARSLGVLNIGDTDATNSYMLATGANTLTFDNGSSDAQLNQISTANGATISGLLAIGGNGNLTISNAASAKTLTLSAGITSALTGGTQTLTFNNANAVSVGGIIADGSSGGTIALTKTGAGTTTLTAANTYTGSTTINQGTLALGGGDNRLATTGTLIFNGSSGTLDVGANNQSLSNLVLSSTATSTSTITGTGGTLSLTGAALQIGSTTSNINQTVDMSGLSNFNYSNASGTINVGAIGTTNSVGTWTLAGTTVITAASVGIAANAPNNGSNHQGVVHLGQTNTINADNILIGSTSGTGTLDFQAGLTAPTLKIRGTGGTDSDRAAVVVGTNSGYTGASGTFNGGTGVLDAKISTLKIGENTRNSAMPSVSGTFSMGAGTLDATTVTIAHNVSGGTSSNSSFVQGTFNLNGGTATIATLQISKRDVSGIANTVANFNLNGGTLNVTSLQVGATGSTGGNANFTWADGTLSNISGSNQTVSNAGAAPVFTLTNTNNVSGTHTWNVNGSDTSTVNTVVISGEGSLTKIGTGTLTFGAANTYSGDTFANFGTLATNATGKLGTGHVTVASGAKLTLGNNVSIGDLSTLTFDSTSIASSISLNFSGIETLGYVYDSITATYLAGGTYTAAQLNSAFLTSVFTGIGSLTVSAIPEPSNYPALFGALTLTGAFCKRRRTVRR